MKNSAGKYVYYDTWTSLSRAHRVVYKIRDRELMAKCGISIEQSGILFLLASLDHSPTLTEICQYLVREPHTVFVTTNGMAKLGLLEKSRDSKRKNVCRFTLTEKGLKVYRSSTERKSLNYIMSVLSEEERRQLVSSLDKILKRGIKLSGHNHKLLYPSAQLERDSKI